MAILGLQGVRGGVGTTSLTAALAWALQILGENVLVIDASPDNLLRMSFNVDFVHQGGWARSLLDGQDWRDAGLRYTSQLDLLPFSAALGCLWMILAWIVFPLEHPRWQRIRDGHKALYPHINAAARARWTRPATSFRPSGW
ncbi:cell division protein [Salmonella enterica subsp. enterica]|uniref:Cell division protein n=1 Tax=Salmonella enterica I TaxID=59201 RepID=A0A379VK53_SALET|nr:cell division protein [Salmonella enterica subsp. enterica]